MARSSSLSYIVPLLLQVGVTVIVGVIGTSKWLFLSVTPALADYFGVQNLIAIQSSTGPAVFYGAASNNYVTATMRSYFLQILIIVFFA
jgi:hypothetical protein